jgi:hypothetical protein
MNDYQKEQYAALICVREYLTRLTPPAISELKKQASAYFDFRKRVDRFLDKHFSSVCTRSCYQNQLSACCSRDGIITFFADVVISALVSSAAQIDALCVLLRKPNTGYKCIYLGNRGCTWRIKPIVCEMFLCDASLAKIFEKTPQAKQKWEAYQLEKKRFIWPDQPVLFDTLESYFIEAGYTSTLMHMHNSPGLLRVKQKSNFGD